MVGIILIAIIVVWGGFVMYLLVKHPDTAFKLQDRMIQAQKDYEAKKARQGKVMAKGIGFILRRWLR